MPKASDIKATGPENPKPKVLVLSFLEMSITEMNIKEAEVSPEEATQTEVTEKEATGKGTKDTKIQSQKSSPSPPK